VPTLANMNQIWRFGVYEVDTRRVEMRRGGTPVKMREQSFFILVYLLEHANEIVTREELHRVLWPSDIFVDFDHSLNTAVMKLRDALGDSADTPLYIETIPKRGYRFIAPVSQAADARNGFADSNGALASPPVNAASGAQQLAPAPAESPPSYRRLGRIAVVVGLILLAAGGSAVFFRPQLISTLRHDGNKASSAYKIVPITTTPGTAVSPVFSPDGRDIAYLWDGPERRHFDVYVQLLGSDTPLQLTHNKSGLIGPPAWSPDGREIAFSRCDGKNDGVYVVPALGGDERKLTGDERKLPTGRCSLLAWLADGTQMLMLDHCSAADSRGVVLFSLSTGEKQCLTNSVLPEGSSDVFTFSLSPDGRTIAFAATKSGSALSADIFTIPLSGGTLHQLTAEKRYISNLMWTPDGKSIVFASNRTTLMTLWRVSANGGPIQPETTFPAIGSLSRDGQRLAYQEQTIVDGPVIWRADLASAGGSVLDNKEIIHTQYGDLDPQPSPDGAQIAFHSLRTGSAEIWKSGATGGSPLQLTHLGTFSGTPRWSPDGKWIAFDNYTGDSTQIFVVDSEGRNLHSITDGPDKNSVPSWSRDGRFIYFVSNRTGSLQVWRHAMEGGAEVQLTKHGGVDPLESYDGRTIYFSKVNQAGIWSIPAGGGTESLVVADKPQAGIWWGSWTVAQDGLYLLDAEAKPRPRIEFYRFATRRTVPVLSLVKLQIYILSATADGRTIYYTQYERQSVIKMMEISH
jgi:Tol biopolymer transport system component/DNA-binding winged helix-turn-helix (wHTH) protein